MTAVTAVCRVMGQIDREISVEGMAVLVALAHCQLPTRYAGGHEKDARLPAVVSPTLCMGSKSHQGCKLPISGPVPLGGSGPSLVHNLMVPKPEGQQSCAGKRLVPEGNSYNMQRGMGGGGGGSERRYQDTTSYGLQPVG